MFSASASATCHETASGTASATGNSLNEAITEAINLANTAAFFSLTKPPHPPKDVHSCKYCVFSCIDFRFVDDTGYYMNIHGNCNNYDQFVLAGASLGYNGIPGYENWILFGNQNIQLSHNLHEITEVNIFDHLNCGAYKLVYTPEQLAGDGEYELHVENLNKAQETLLSKFSFLTKVNKFIINMDYEVIQIP